MKEGPCNLSRVLTLAVGHMPVMMAVSVMQVNRDLRRVCIARLADLLADETAETCVMAARELSRVTLTLVRPEDFRAVVESNVILRAVALLRRTGAGAPERKAECRSAGKLLLSVLYARYACDLESEGHF